jgi:hypothetical protein
MPRIWYLVEASRKVTASAIQDTIIEKGVELS